LISQSSNDLNLTFVVDEVDADGLLPVLHDALIDSGAMPVQDAAVFGPSWRDLFQADARIARETPWWHAARERLLESAAQGTPRYVYDLATVRARARSIADVPAIDRRFYALKANAHPDILRALQAEGFGFECVSLAEVEHALATLPGIDRRSVLFTPSFAPRAEYEAALALDVVVTVDNVEALRAWPEVFRGRALWLRIDLGRGDGHHAKVRTGGRDAKFGLPLSKVEAFTDEARRIGATIVGLHAHLGSGIDAPAHWREVYAELAGIADDIGTVATIDIGGGLPIPYRPEDRAFDLDAWAAGLADIKSAYARYALAVEPGRFLAAEAGALLLHVTQVVEKDGLRRVGADAGMNALMRPAMYDAWHGIHNLSRLNDAETALFDVVGPICESSDVIGTQRALPTATTEGDVLLIADAGAYGMSMANRYNLRALPVEEVFG